MSPAASAATEPALPPVGPITFGRKRSKSVQSSGKKDSMTGCPMQQQGSFVRPDLVSRCTWKAGETKADLKTMTQGPHTLDKP